MTPEAYFISYLTGALTPPPINGVAQAGVPVSGCVPHPMPDEFVTVELTGSSRIDQIDHVTLSIECWSTSRDAACNLMARVDAAMRISPVNDEVSRCELETSYNDTDQDMHRPRYHARYAVVYLGGN